MKTALFLIFFSIIVLEGVALACLKESGFKEVGASSEEAMSHPSPQGAMCSAI